MKTNNSPYTAGRFIRVFSTLVLVAFLSVALSTEAVLAVTTYGRAFLINTEAFDTIDDGDATSNIELRFGDSSRTILYDVTLSAFVFSGNVRIRGTLSGNIVHAEKSLTSSGTLRALGNTAIGAEGFIGETQLDVLGTISGSIVRASNNLLASGALVIESGAIIDGGTFHVSAAGNRVGIGAVNNTAGTELYLTGDEFWMLESETDARFVFGDSSGVFGYTSWNSAGNYAQMGTNAHADILELRQAVASGSFLHAEKNLTSSGTLQVLGNAAFGTAGFIGETPVDVLGTISGSRLTISGNANITGAILSVGNITTRGTFSGKTLRVGDGGADIHGPLNASGSIRTDADLTLGADDAAANVTLTFMNSGTDGQLRWVDSVGMFELTRSLFVLGSLSGESLRVSGGADIHGLLNTSGSIRTDADLTLGADDAATDVTLTFMNSGTDETLTWQDTADKFSFSNDIRVLGNISGSTLTVDRNASVSGSLAVDGTLSGNTIFGFGLNTDCDTEATSKLMWDATLGRFSCGADQTGGSSGGLSYATASGIFVNRGGGTMTGSLTLTMATGAIVVSSGANVGTNVLSMAVQGAVSYVGLTSNGSTDLRIFDVRNSARPTAIGGIELGASANDLVIDGKYLYVGLSTVGGSDFVIYDLTKPSTPALQGGVDLSAAVTALYVAGKYAYIGTSGVMSVVDVSNPRNPRVIGTHNTTVTPTSIVVRDGVAYITTTGAGGGVETLDVRDPTKPARMDYDTAENGVSANELVLSGKYAYIAGVDDSFFGILSIFDISNPSSVVSLVTVSFPNTINTVSLAGKYLFLGTTTAQAGAEFFVYDISNPASPRYVSSFTTGWVINVMRVYGKTLHIGINSAAVLDYLIYNITGIEAEAATIGALQAGSLNVTDDATVTHDLSVGGALTAGQGIFATGPSTLSSYSGSYVLNIVQASSRTGALVITAQGGTTAPHISFGSGNALDTNLFRSAVNTLKTSGSFFALGTISGTDLFSTKSITGSYINATSTFAGAGLANCTGASNKLTWLSSTKRFSCENDEAGGSSGGNWSNTGSLLNFFNSKYVNTSGDTMTGALTIDILGGTIHSLGLKLVNTFSGASIHAEKFLTSSGTLVTESGAYIDGSTLVIQAGSNRVGIGTSTPATVLDVIGGISGTALEIRGTMSGRSLYVSGTGASTLPLIATDVSKGFVGFGTNAPISQLHVQGGSISTFHIGGGTDAVTLPTSYSQTGMLDGFRVESFRTAAGVKYNDIIASEFGGFDPTNFRFFTVASGDGSASERMTITSTGRVGIGTTAPTALLDVGGTISGRTLRITSGGADIHGVLNSSGAIRTDDNLTLNADDEGGKPVTLTFMNPGTDEEFWWDDTLDRFSITDDIQILGNISGSSLAIDNAATISGTLLVKNSITSKATISGTDLYASKSISGKYLNASDTFAGAGLSNCTGLTSKLTWLSSTKRFGCENDETGGTGGGDWSNTGSLLNFFNSKYVNTSGDTMTGALTIDLLNTGAGTGLIMREKAYFGSGVTLSGALVYQSVGSQSIAPSGNLKSFVTSVAGRPLTSNRGPSGAQYQLQPSLFSKLVMMLSTGGGTTVNGYGTTVTNDTTVSHPAADQTFGYMANFATSTTNNDTAGTSSINTAWFRGSTTGANGFFFKARVGVVDTTSIRVFTGLANQTIATMVGADAPTGDHIGFQFSTNRSDVNWQFEMRDGTTQNVVNTGIAFAASKVYELSFYCTSQCTSVTWQVNNITDGTVASGSTSSNLPTTTVALRIVHGVSTLTTAARNIRMQWLYSEADR